MIETSIVGVGGGSSLLWEELYISIIILIITRTVDHVIKHGLVMFRLLRKHREYPHKRTRQYRRFGTSNGTATLGCKAQAVLVFGIP